VMAAEAAAVVVSGASVSVEVTSSVLIWTVAVSTVLVSAEAVG
jgi:hypothetical protein